MDAQILAAVGNDADAVGGGIEVEAEALTLEPGGESRIAHWRQRAADAIHREHPVAAAQRKHHSVGHAIVNAEEALSGVESGKRHTAGDFARLCSGNGDKLV